MKKFLAISALALVASSNHPAWAGPCATPPLGPPTGPVDWYNTLVMVDITGSMSGMHATSPVPITKLQQALIQAKNHVLEMQAKAGMAGKPLSLALWAFDSGFSSTQFVKKVIDFTDSKTPAAVLKELGFDALGNPTPATLNPVFTPSGSTPLAAAACYAVGQIAANFNAANVAILPGGYQWGTTIGSPPRLANIERAIFIESDGLENATPSTNECAGTTSASMDYLCYEPGTWQYALRNKLQTGNAANAILSTSSTGLIFNVDYIFTNAVTGGLTASAVTGEPVSHFSGATTNTTQPTLAQADTLFGGLAKMTKGTYKTVTVAANGTTIARRPGDVNGDGCVDTSDYNQLATYYGQQCVKQLPCIAADLNGDSFVDFSDYLILTANMGAGCPAP